MFDTLNAAQEAGKALAEQKIEFKIEDNEEEIGETPDFEDPDAPKEKPSKEDEEEKEFEEFAIAGKDETGARIAFDTIAGSNIEDNIRKLVRLLGDDAKRKEAQEYFKSVCTYIKQSKYNKEFLISYSEKELHEKIELYWQLYLKVR